MPLVVPFHLPQDKRKIIKTQKRRASASSVLSYDKTAFISTFLCGILLSTVWRHNVDKVVPNPYLDEVFHIRQAQAYWAGRWKEWDPKITTPFGLYIFSWAILTMSLALNARKVLGSTADLRWTNGAILFNLLQLELRKLLGLLHAEYAEPDSPELDRWAANLTALNICLFPLVFFLSGVYYTDLAALLIVIEVYIHDVKREWERKHMISRRDLIFVACGILSLAFRQTNIFWAAVFLGGLKTIRVLKGMTNECRSTDTMKIVRSSWFLGQLYDPPINEASFLDYFKTAMSLVLAGLAYFISVTVALIPYFIFLGAFGLFVLWNGGVVLGHKEYHAASLHLPQMLYIWPCFMFFSWPIFTIPYFTAPYNTLNRVHSAWKSHPTIPVTILFIFAMLLAVHFNTIIHPFTLADNRHYVFYVFRILLRNSLFKYAATPIYFVCASATISTLSPPFLGAQMSNSNKASRNKGYKKSVESPKTPKDVIKVSFLLVWFLATAASLITTPLVEPRYFIIPWVMWRIHVFRVPSRHGSGVQKYMPLLVEGIWYLVINAITGWVFLNKKFEWPQEPEQDQRFMW